MLAVPRACCIPVRAMARTLGSCFSEMTVRTLKMVMETARLEAETRVAEYTWFGKSRDQGWRQMTRLQHPRRDNIEGGLPAFRIS